MNFIDKNRDPGLKCPRCDFENPMYAKSCRECGTDLTTACTDCGHKVRTGAKFCDECGARLALSQTDDEMLSELHSSMAQSLASKILPSRKQMKGERKNVTILFSDISGFTQMSEKLDPEEVIDLINSCFKKLTEIIYRYEGTVDKYMGDCIIALFGAPVAHEDDPERAVKAAMEIMETLDELKKSLSIPIDMHVGLNTGLVVAGSIGSDLRKQYTVIGDAVNTASRIQSVAQPGQILVGQSVYRLTKDVFNFAEGGEITVKGKKKPIRVYTPLGIRPRLTRFGKARAKGLTPFVGREHELTSLKDFFTKSAKGEGQAVGISGEAGVGKSRLLYEFIQDLDPDVLYLEGDCIPHGRVSPYQPFLGVIRQYLGLPEQVTEEEREAITKRLDDLKEYVPCFEDLLSLPPSDPEYSQLPRLMRRKKTFEGLIALFQQAAAAQPLVLALDELQWLDETSQEVITSILDAIGSSRILLVLISRPEFQPPWQEHFSYTSLSMSILPRTEGQRLVQALFDAPVSSELEEFILRRTEGNPFFVEELTRALRETQAVTRNGSYSLAVSPGKLSVPETVQGVLAARMDRLDGETKNTLQVASVIGREFDTLVLEKVSEAKGNKLKGQLDILTGTGFIQSQTQRDTAYTFNHTLTRDVAYETLLKVSRRKLHRQVGIKKPIVVGHSMGGLIALETAARYPDYPAGIVVMDTPIAPPAPFVEGLRQFAGALRTPMHREAVVQFLNQFIGFGDDPGRRSEVMNGMLGFAQHVGASSLESYVSYDTVAAAAACKVPILYIGAGFGFADLARFKELTPQLMVAQTVGSGHYNQLEVPDQVNAMIERFIAVSGRDAR